MSWVKHSAKLRKISAEYCAGKGVKSLRFSVGSRGTLGRALACRSCSACHCGRFIFVEEDVRWTCSGKMGRLNSYIQKRIALTD